nr:immunoglobulin heavy chain junction region [Mus musculus]
CARERLLLRSRGDYFDYW